MGPDIRRRADTIFVELDIAAGFLRHDRFCYFAETRLAIFGEHPLLSRSLTNCDE